MGHCCDESSGHVHTSYHSPNTSQHCTSESMFTLLQPPSALGRASLPQSALKETSKPGTLSAVSLTVETSSYRSIHSSCKGRWTYSHTQMQQVSAAHQHELWTAVCPCMHIYIQYHTVQSALTSYASLNALNKFCEF